MTPKEFLTKMEPNDVVVTEIEDGFALSVPSPHGDCYPVWRLACNGGVAVRNAVWNAPQGRWEIKYPSQVTWGRSLDALADVDKDRAYQSLQRAKSAYLSHLKKADRAFEEMSIPSFRKGRT